MYKYVLIPGRHHLITNFQASYFSSLLEGKVNDFASKEPIIFRENPTLVWAITSANHANTRRNPIPGDRRLGMIESITSHEQYDSLVFRITNMEPKEDFAHYLIEEIKLLSRGNTMITPENCVIASSTPSVIEQYQKIGYKIAPIELCYEKKEFITPRAWDVVEKITNKSNWYENKSIQELMHPKAIDYYQRYNLAELIIDTFTDPLALDDGDITDTRDYEIYRSSFEDNAFRKVNDFIDYVEPGKILDIGCASGQTIKLLTDEPRLFESDFYGVEIARPLHQICENRKNNGEFGLSNVFFYQRNIMNSEYFEDNSLNTVITMALTHEIESYMGHGHLLMFIQKIYDMLAPGGVYINYDVSGPNNLNVKVYVKFNNSDGDNPQDLRLDLKGKELSEFLATLSSESRFIRFTNDFRKIEGDGIKLEVEMVQDQKYYVMNWSELCEFLAKKDYTDSWLSEMHEKFCFWNINDWKKELEQVGFQLERSSRPIKNQWLIDNRFAPSAEVFTKQNDGSLVAQKSPDTNVLVVARKPQ